MTSVQIKVLRQFRDIFEQAKDTGSLWVVNASDDKGRRPRGEIFMQLKDENGTDQAIYVPATWLPVDLLQNGTLESFEKSTNFRQYINKELLVAIDKETVKSLQSLPAAKDERERVSALIRSRSNFGLMGNMADTTMSLSLDGQNTISAEQDRREADSVLHDGNTENMSAILRLVNSTPIGSFANIHGELVRFMTSATREEVQSLAASVENANSPVFFYTDAALNAFSEGKPVDNSMFQDLDKRSADSGDVSFQIS